MLSIYQAPLAIAFAYREQEEKICSVKISEISTPENVVESLAALQGPVDVICWYEGCRGLPTRGAVFMTDYIFKPLFQKKRDVRLMLYSLKAWDFKNSVKRMSDSTQLGDAIGRMNSAAVRCLDSASFFRYCAKVREGGLYNYFQRVLPEKRYLVELSAGRPNKGMRVSELFNERRSLFNCIKGKDVSLAYSQMQYVEGYYQVQESVRSGISKNQKTIQIAFLLPNDEGKYYADFPNDIEEMLLADFGDALKDTKVNITFLYFQYGDDSDSRPYIDKTLGASYVNGDEVLSYFDFLAQQPSKQLLNTNLNGAD